MFKKRDYLVIKLNKKEQIIPQNSQAQSDPFCFYLLIVVSTRTTNEATNEARTKL